MASQPVIGPEACMSTAKNSILVVVVDAVNPNVVHERTSRLPFDVICCRPFLR